MASAPQLADLRTGVVIILCTTALLGGVIWLPGILEPEPIDVTTRFPFSSGVQGVKPGTPVYLGGLQMGTVKSLTLVPETPGTPAYFEMVTSMMKETLLPRSATVGIEQSITGGETRIVIHLPQITGAQETIKPGEVIQATPIRSTMERIFGDERAANLARSIEIVRHHNFATNYQDLDERLKGISAESIALKQDVEADWDAWRIQASAVLDGYDSARVNLERIDAMMAAGQPLDREKLTAAFDRIRGNFADCSQSIATLKARWSEQILPPLMDLIDRFSRHLQTAKNDYAVVRAIFADGQDALDRSRADLMIAGGQLDRAVTEMTLMPWVLLGGALEDKSDNAQYQKLAREIVRSTAELHMAISTAKTLLEHDPRLLEKYPQLVELLMKWMDGASEKQNQAGNEMLDHLIGPAKK